MTSQQFNSTRLTSRGLSDQTHPAKHTYTQTEDTHTQTHTRLSHTHVLVPGLGMFWWKQTTNHRKLNLVEPVVSPMRFNMWLTEKHNDGCRLKLLRVGLYWIILHTSFIATLHVKF